MGVRGQGREKGGVGAAGISWALHFEAVGGSLGRKLQSRQRAEAAKLVQARRFTRAEREVCPEQLIYKHSFTSHYSNHAANEAAWTDFTGNCFATL